MHFKYVDHNKNETVFECGAASILEADKLYQQQTGKVYQKSCRTNLGSRECGMYLPNLTFSGYVKGIQEDGPAALAGIRPVDVIVKIENQNVVDTMSLLARVAALKPGNAARFSVERKGQIVELDVVPGARPSRMRVPVQK